MIIPDVNLLIYAHNDGASEHEDALRWWEGLLNDEEEVGLPWAVVISFIRLMTRVRPLERPIAIEDAVGYVREWISRPQVSILNPGPNHLDYVERILSAVRVGGNLVPDSHIAALAMEHGAVVHTNDRDFSRFPGLSWRNPL